MPFERGLLPLISQLFRMRSRRMPLFAAPTVIAGDFNGNPCFDKPRQRSKWADVFGRINDLGSLSAYHQVRGLGYDDEVVEPTHHHLRNTDRSFHIDFCFVPRTWFAAGVKASERGEFWRSLSDHFPVVVHVGR